MTSVVRRGRELLKNDWSGDARPDLHGDMWTAATASIWGRPEVVASIWYMGEDGRVGEARQGRGGARPWEGLCRSVVPVSVWLACCAEKTIGV